AGGAAAVWRRGALRAGSPPMAIDGATGSRRRIVSGPRAIRTCKNTHAGNARKNDRWRGMIDVPTVVQVAGHSVALVAGNRPSQLVACLQVSPVGADGLELLVGAAEHVFGRSGAGRISMAVGAAIRSGAEIHCSVRVARGHQTALGIAGLVTSGTSIVHVACRRQTMARSAAGLARPNPRPVRRGVSRRGILWLRG